MTTVYSVNNEIFAAKDLIFGWCFLGEKMGMEQYVPVTMLDKERVKALQELYVGPLYPEDLKQALVKRLEALKADELPPSPAEVIADIPKISSKHITATYSHFVMRAVVKADEVPEVMKPKVKMKDFKIPGRTYPLVNWCSHGDDMWKLMQRFGSSWSKVPDRKDIRYIRDKTKDIQFLMRLDGNGDPTQVELYIGMTFEQFKEAVVSNTIEAKERYVYTMAEMDKKSAELVINALLIHDLW